MDENKFLEKMRLLKLQETIRIVESKVGLQADKREWEQALSENKVSNVKYMGKTEIDGKWQDIYMVVEQFQKEINGKEISGYAEKYYNIRAADTFGKNLSDARDIWEDKTISIGQQINNRPTAVYQNVTLQGRETVNKYLANGAKNHDAEILAVPYASNPNQTYIARGRV